MLQGNDFCRARRPRSNGVRQPAWCERSSRLSVLQSLQFFQRETPLSSFLKLPTKYSRCHIIALASSGPKTLYGRENAFQQAGRWHANLSLTKTLEPL